MPLDDAMDWNVMGPKYRARIIELDAELKRLREKIDCVVETFERDETQGYRSKDRQFAIAVLKD